MSALTCTRYKYLGHHPINIIVFINFQIDINMHKYSIRNSLTLVLFLWKEFDDERSRPRVRGLVLGGIAGKMKCFFINFNAPIIVRIYAYAVFVYNLFK